MVRVGAIGRIGRMGPSRSLRPLWARAGDIHGSEIKLPQYWRRQGGLVTETQQLATSRASSIILPNAAGVYQTIGSNLLPRTDRGVYANGEWINVILSPGDLTSADWTKAGGISVTGNTVQAAGVWFDRLVAVASAGFASQSGGTAGQTVTTVALVKKANTAQAESNIAWRVGTTGFRLRLNWTGTALTSLTVMNGTAIGTPDFMALADGVYLVWFTHTIVADATQLRLYPGQFGTDTANLDIGFTQVFQTSFAPPALVTGTLPASAITAVQGTRPSNGQPEPFPGWEAAGLDAGFSVLMDLENRMRQGSSRTAVSLTDTSNGVVAILNTSSVGTSFRLTAGGGSDTFPGSQTGGRSRAACRVMPDGTFALAQKGQGSVTTGTKASPISLVSTARLTIGNGPALNQPWNDWIYSLQVGQPMADAELLAWVNQ